MKPPTGTELIFEFLKQCAIDMCTVTYSELWKNTQSNYLKSNHQLGYIRDNICIARGLPLLTWIVVSKETNRPSGSFLPEGVTIPSGDVSTKEAWKGTLIDYIWRGMVNQVYATDWTKVYFAINGKE